MKTIARFETARRERNAPHPAPVVDQVMTEERATAFAKRSIKTSAKLAGLKLAGSMMDLTKILKIVDKLRAGVVWANTYNKFDPTSPFGGYKESQPIQRVRAA
jgi:acyl-CoA reductase-like NAD-dependent aldehyde dehydrogenase